MKKNYLFPHWFKVMGWVLSIAAVVAYLCIRDLDFKMPALSFDVLLLDDDDEGSYSFFRLANTNILSIAMPVLTIGLLFIGFSKEKVEDEFVH